MAALLAGCTTAPRRPAPPIVFAAVAPRGFPSDIRTLSDDQHYFRTHLAAQVRALKEAAGKGPIRILAVSGGGAGAAFGAGALYGLTRSGKRPVFQVVTGVSAGALLAPFAFLGSRWDPQLKEAFDSHETENLLEPRGIGFLFHPGFYLGAPLAHLVNRFCTAPMIRAVALQAAKGRLLLVATTDLDKQESVIWNMGEIAQHGGKAARELFCKVLIASASIPGVFPPVLIPVEGGGHSYDEMHVDGSTTMPLFVASAIMEELPLSLNDFRGANVYVIVNGQLNANPKTTSRSPGAVLSRSFSAALMSASRRALVVSADFAHSYHMHFRFTYLPMTYPYQGPLDFKSSNMHASFEYGSHCADENRLWTTFRSAITKMQLSGSQLEAPTDACPGTREVTAH